jgi:hypothetical protein
MIVSFLVIVVVSIITGKPKPEVVDEYIEIEHRISTK